MQCNDCMSVNDRIHVECLLAISNRTLHTSIHGNYRQEWTLINPALFRATTFWMISQWTKSAVDECARIHHVK